VTLRVHVHGADMLLVLSQDRFKHSGRSVPQLHQAHRKYTPISSAIARTDWGETLLMSINTSIRNCQEFRSPKPEGAGVGGID
jgi:hypothetical protein